jgi:nucleotide-binding universal stress UspA family protein
MSDSQARSAYVPNHILIPVDGSPLGRTAVDAALAIAGSPREVTLLLVVNAHGLGGEESLAALDALADELRRRCPDTAVDAIVAQGDPVDEILDTAIRTEPDLIAMATREFLSPSRPVTDTVSAQVASLTSIPVLIVHGEPAAVTPARVVVPLDGSLRSLQALPIAAGIAHLAGGSVHLVTVIDPTVSLPAAYAYSCPDCDCDLQDALASLQCQANALLDDAEQRLRDAGVPVTSELIRGKTAPSLLGVVRPGDVVVVTTRGAGRHASPHIGSTATRLLRGAGAPVIVFHPRLAATIIRNPLTTDWEAMPPLRAIAS